MYNEIGLQQEGGWVLISYVIISLTLFFVFLFLKINNDNITPYFKVIAFFTVFLCASIQYWIFQYGMAKVYAFFSLFPLDSDFLRFCALFFCLSYLFFLPVRSFGKKNKK
ncbi:hypothetical protein AAGQ96_03195 [Pantoea sp. MBD-2R]|uniref:hypothetical protein n=1 Tax=Pantoea sp. MBD-2R TaxID=3141540 RepID=UPI003182DDFA